MLIKTLAKMRVKAMLEEYERTGWKVTSAAMQQAFVAGYNEGRATELKAHIELIEPIARRQA